MIAPERLVAMFEASIKQWHDENLEVFDFQDNESYVMPIDKLVMQLSCANYSCWHAEDYARGSDINKIVWAKRAIDKHNQLRNDIIEQIDDIAITKQVYRPKMSSDTYNTETIGSIIDRINILCLKEYHTRELLNQTETTNNLNISLKLDERLRILDEQKTHLVTELDKLWIDMRTGTRIIKVFKQLKLYNDPQLNKKHRDNDHS